MSETAHAVPGFVDRDFPSLQRHAIRPTAREWSFHFGLFILTAFTATIAGAMIVSTSPDPRLPLVTWLDYVSYVPVYYWKTVLALLAQSVAQPAILAQGLTFSASLLAILTSHEAGHYIACRYYGVDATLPFFIPAPPLFLAGTFGAFIKIKSPIPSRRALFDIGLAGPLAGFIVLIPIAIAGVLTLQPVAIVPGDAIVFNDPLLFRLLARLFKVRLADVAPNAFYMAAWIGLLVTSLNLLPVGQLDGGHATYAIFGGRTHAWLGRTAFAVMLTLTVLGWLWHSSPSGFLITVLLAVMLRVRHPQPHQTEPLGQGRLAVAIITLVVFALSFWPFPVTIT